MKECDVLIFVMYNLVDYHVDKHVRFWKGFIPIDAVDKFVEIAEERHWGYVIEDPYPKK